LPRPTLFPSTTLFRSGFVLRADKIGPIGHGVRFGGAAEIPLVNRLDAPGAVFEGGPDSAQHLVRREAIFELRSPILQSSAIQISDRKSTRLNSSHVKI